MAMKECPSCAMNVDQEANVCPICGYEFPQRSKGVMFLAVILLIVTILYLIY